MTNPSSAVAPTAVPTNTAGGQGAAVRTLNVLLYSDDIATRDAVRVGVGRRPARDVEIASWRECATEAAVFDAVEKEQFDLLILDGEAAKVGGLGMCRQLKSEVVDCPPVIVLTGRPQDGWLASWSEAEAAVPHPLDPLKLATAIADVARHTAARS